MGLNKNFINSVTEKNIVEIRDWFWSRVATKTLSERFEEEIEYCKSKGIMDDLYQLHDGRDVNLQATEENFSILAGQLRNNFSKERLNALKKMAKILYPQKKEELQPIYAKPSLSETTDNSKKKGEQTNIGNRFLATLTAAVGIIIFIAIILSLSSDF